MSGFFTLLNIMGYKTCLHAEALSVFICIKGSINTEKTRWSVPLRESLFHCNHFLSMFITLTVLHCAGTGEPDLQLAKIREKICRKGQAGYFHSQDEKKNGEAKQPA